MSPGTKELIKRLLGPHLPFARMLLREWGLALYVVVFLGGLSALIALAEGDNVSRRPADRRPPDAERTLAWLLRLVAVVSFVAAVKAADFALTASAARGQVVAVLERGELRLPFGGTMVSYRPRVRFVTPWGAPVEFESRARFYARSEAESRVGAGVEGNGRIRQMQDTGNPFCPRFADRDWNILRVVQEVAQELRRSPAQIALNWVARQPQVSSTIIGAKDVGQLGDILAALEFQIPPEQLRRLDECSRLAGVYPYTFFTPEQKTTMAGGVPVREAILTR